MTELCTWEGLKDGQEYPRCTDHLCCHFVTLEIRRIFSKDVTAICKADDVNFIKEGLTSDMAKIALNCPVAQNQALSSLESRSLSGRELTTVHKNTEISRGYKVFDEVISPLMLPSQHYRLRWALHQGFSCFLISSGPDGRGQVLRASQTVNPVCKAVRDSTSFVGEHRLSGLSLQL